jgi:ribonuclease H2 subunit A
MWLIQSVLDEGVDLSAVFIDTVGDPGKYQAKLEERFPSLIVTVAKKAGWLLVLVVAHMCWQLVLLFITLPSLYPS